jgi:hypothetical protein
MATKTVFILDPQEGIDPVFVAKLLQNLFGRLGIAFTEDVVKTFSEEEQKHFKQIEAKVKEESRIIKPR